MHLSKEGSVAFTRISKVQKKGKIPRLGILDFNGRVSANFIEGGCSTSTSTGMSAIPQEKSHDCPMCGASQLILHRPFGLRFVTHASDCYLCCRCRCGLSPTTLFETSRTFSNFQYVFKIIVGCLKVRRSAAILFYKL